MTDDAQPAPPDDETVLRSAAWALRGIAFNPRSVLYLAAKERNLGMPVTGEFISRGRVCQGYQGGICYVKFGCPGEVGFIPWL